MPAFKPAPVVLTIGHSTRTMTYDITSLGFPPWLRLSHYLNFRFLAPLSILTGPAMSPAFTARFPWYLRLFGNRQNARSLHFLALVGYLIFIPIHMGLVIIENFPQKMDQIVLGW